MVEPAAARAPSKRTSLRAKLLLLLLVTFLCLLVVEAGLRIFWQPPAMFMAAELRGTKLFVPNDKLGWKMAPNISLDFRWFWGETSTIRTNSFGFRDVEHTHERTEGTPRVMVLGDSHAFGYGVREEETFASQLRTLLPGVEILNLAETGYNTRQTRALFEEEGIAFRPDVVVLAFSENDVGPQVIPTAVAVTGDNYVDPWYIRCSYLLQLLRERVNSNKRIAKAMVALRIKDKLGGYKYLDTNLRPALRNYPPELAHVWEETCAELRLLRDACAGAGAKLVIAAIPAFQSVDPERLDRSISYVEYERDDFDLEKPYRKLGEFCTTEGIPYIDARPAFLASQESGDPPHLKYDLHINATGHRIMAELLAPCLRTMTAGQ